MSLLEDQSVRSAELETSIRVLKKDIAEIEAERKAVLKARTAAQEAGDAATVTALTQKSSELLQEGTRAINQLSVYEAEKTEIDAQIYRLQLQAQQEAQASKAPIPVNTGSNPGGVPAGPTSTITEGNRNDPLPVTKASDPNLAQNAATTNEAAQDKKLPVEPNLAQNAATTNEAIQDKKPTEIDELSAYPPNTVAQQSTEIDEESAYPPYTQVGRTLGGAHVDNATPVKISGDPPIDRKMADADYTNNLIPTSGERGPNVGFESNKTALRDTQAAQTEQTAQKFKAQEDWRVRLSLAPGATYLYKVGQGAAGILNPLQATDGVIFPYTPAISVTYNAGYDATDVTHSNYKFFSYKNSNVDNVTITADFTAQDTAEAQYLLAVIHFFRSVTKMFYGKDPGPGPGVPPPLCYLNGLGSFQFDWHPLVINNFTYALPTDVDYIRAMDTASRPGVNIGSGQPKGKSGEDPTAQRMAGGGIQPGALAAAPKFKNDSGNKDAVTYVPTKMSITIQAYPIVSRNDVSNNFSLKEYATGKLLRGSQRQSGGFW